MRRKGPRKKLSAGHAELLDALLSWQARKDKLLAAADAEARQRYTVTASKNHSLAEAELLTHVYQKKEKAHANATQDAAPARRAGLEKVRGDRWPKDDAKEARRATVLHLHAVHGAKYSERRIAKEILGDAKYKTTVRRWITGGGPIRSDLVRCLLCKKP